MNETSRLAIWISNLLGHTLCRLGWSHSMTWKLSSGEGISLSAPPPEHAVCEHCGVSQRHLNRLKAGWEIPPATGWIQVTLRNQPGVPKVLRVCDREKYALIVRERKDGLLAKHADVLPFDEIETWIRY